MFHVHAYRLNVTSLCLHLLRRKEKVEQDGDDNDHDQMMKDEEDDVKNEKGGDEDDASHSEGEGNSKREDADVRDVRYNLETL